MSTIYFDNASTTQVNTTLFNNIKDYSQKFYANPSSIHYMGKNAKNALERAREDIRNLLSLDKDKKITFTSCATESNNIVLQSLLKKNKGKIISTKIEHPSVEENLNMLSQFGFKIEYLDIKNGQIDIDDFKKKLTEDTVLVSIIHTSNIFGVVNNIKEAAECTLSYSKTIGKKILFHTDSTQSLLKINIDYNSLFSSGVDAITFSSHKCFSPRGCGLLVTANNAITPLSRGGGQEEGIRGGTENLLSILLFRDTLQEELKNINLNIDYVKNLNTILVNEAEKIGLYPIYNIKEKVPHITSFYQKWLPSEVFARLLSENNICVGTLSACSSNKTNNAIKSIEKKSENSIRVSLSHYNTEEEINSFTCIVKNIIEKYKY